MRKIDVAVVGAGVMGAATARALARRGRTVGLFERREVGHDHGSSHGRSRIFRFSYHDPVYVRMAMEALPLWRALEAEAGEDLLTVTGGLDAGPAADVNAAALGQVGARFEWLEPPAARERFGLAYPGGTRLLFQPDAGWLRADRAWAALSRLAVAGGAELHENTPVEALLARDEEVEVRAAGETVRASVAVVTAGAWSKDLLGQAGVELAVRPTRETLVYFALREGPPPPPLVEWGTPSRYALPDPAIGMKAGEHQAGPTIDPDAAGAPDGASVERLRAWVAERFPGADPEPIHVQTCLYTNTPDEDFVLERHGNVVVGSACSGHGFKFAPLIGERLADLAS